MNNSINIRKATQADLDGVEVVENECFDGDQFSRRQFSYLISHAKGSFLVAELGGNIIGYISLLQHSGSRSVRIYSVAVVPAYRGRQLGQRFVDISKEYAKEKGLRQVSLEVNINNKAAISLYHKNGFVVTTAIREYYHDGSDALRMRTFF